MRKVSTCRTVTSSTYLFLYLCDVFFTMGRSRSRRSWRVARYVRVQHCKIRARRQIALGLSQDHNGGGISTQTLHEYYDVYNKYRTRRRWSLNATKVSTEDRCAVPLPRTCHRLILFGFWTPRSSDGTLLESEKCTTIARAFSDSCISPIVSGRTSLRRPGLTWPAECSVSRRLTRLD